MNAERERVGRVPWRNRPPSETCEVRRGPAFDLWCHRPAVAAYPAMGGGWMSLCAEHAPKHASISVSIEAARRGQLPQLGRGRRSVPRQVTGFRDRSDLAARVRDARIAAGLTQATLAARIGAFPGSVSQAERGLGCSGVLRRLIPLEAERLMGWPDNWTNVPDENGKPASDAARYKACGNGVVSHCTEWIGARLQMIHDATMDAPANCLASSVRPAAPTEERAA